MAFPVGWSRRQEIQIQASHVHWTGVDFTVRLFRLHLDNEVCSPTDPNRAQADGGDIRFSLDAAGTTPLPYDLIEFGHDSADGVPDASVLIAVKIPSLTASQATSFYVWYNTAGTETTTSSTGAYDSGWGAYYPLTSDFNSRLGLLNLTGNVGSVVAGSGTSVYNLPSTRFNGTQMAYYSVPVEDRDLLYVSPGTWTARTKLYTQDGNSVYVICGACLVSSGTIAGNGIAIAGNGDGVWRHRVANNVTALNDFGNIAANAPGVDGTGTVWNYVQQGWGDAVVGSSMYNFWDGTIDQYGGTNTADLSGGSLYRQNHFHVGATSSTVGVARDGVDADIQHCAWHTVQRSQEWLLTEDANMRQASLFAVPGAPSAPLSGPPVNTVAPVISKVV